MNWKGRKTGNEYSNEVMWKLFISMRANIWKSGARTCKEVAKMVWKSEFRTLFG
jgi:hypothetical protein